MMITYNEYVKSSKEDHPFDYITKKQIIYSQQPEKNKCDICSPSSQKTSKGTYY
ncbi:hypothetical protein HHI36_004990, partial [Cryptolaemus montrouzieri]